MPQKKTWSELVQNQNQPSTTRSVDNQVPLEENELKLPSTTKSISLDEIMSEQLAFDLSPILPSNEAKDSSDILDIKDIQETDQKSADCSNDEMLAKLLQHELDLEHDRMLKIEEKQYNANSKVMLSFERRRRIKTEDLSDSDLDEEVHHEYGEESKHWDFFEETEKQAPKIGKQGYVVSKNGNITTKHDIEITKCRNACKVMEFDSDINTGDGGGFEMKLSNKVFNALKVHNISEGKRMARLHEKKEKSSAEKAVDEKSRILLFKLLDRGILETMNGIIATGKESVVIHGIGQNAEKNITTQEVVIKVFKTTITEFQNRIQYIVGDPILEQTGKLSKQNPKLAIPLWAEKEMHNLNRMRKNGINCPEVVLLKKNILIMTFIGKDGKPAPQLKNLIATEETFKKVWEHLVRLIIKLYRECDMIHADLSEYNLLWYENKLWCIDVSQAVRTTHPMAYRFLWRDCFNICKFFSKKLCDFKSPSKLFEAITGKSLADFDDDGDFLSVETFDKIKNYHKDRRKDKTCEQQLDPDFFEELFEKAIQSRNTGAAVKA